MVPVEAIVTDPDLQPWAKIDRSTVERYAELLRDGVALPPVELVTDGRSIWLADGFHRVFAHKEAGLAQIEAIVRRGDKLDALRISLQANFQHGRPRTEKDPEMLHRVLRHLLAAGCAANSTVPVQECDEVLPGANPTLEPANALWRPPAARQTRSVLNRPKESTQR
jgi:hypothetical protein